MADSCKTIIIVSEDNKNICSFQTVDCLNSFEQASKFIEVNRLLPMYNKTSVSLSGRYCAMCYEMRGRKKG